MPNEIPKQPKPKKPHPVRNRILIGILLFIVGFAGYKLIAGWVDTWPKLSYTYGTASGQAEYPECRFAVISDTHYYDTALGDTGEAFEKYLANDRKLLTESRDILDAAIDDILASDAQFVLVSGDLTKDGEKQNHEQVAAELKKLTDKGIKVYVAPGNHDVMNPRAYSYSGGATASVPSVTAGEFAQIYGGLGYGNALYRDEGSLSYVAEPVPGLWLVCMDSTRWYDNEPGKKPVTAGKFTQAEEDWLAGMLRNAKDEGKAVMVMMHHGVVEHWAGQSRLHPEYLISDYRHVAQMLASWDVRLVFTGHYHAQDVAKADFGSKGFVYDVETGSLVTDPCPVRYCEIGADQRFGYRTVRLADSMYPGRIYADYGNFEQYAAGTLKEAIAKIAFNTLKRYLVNDRDAQAIAGCVAAAFVAHYAGDEDISKAPPLDRGGLTLWGRIVLAQEQYVLDGLWNDPSVKADNNGSFSLTGD
jgi:3',5'-cyclic AMP phosphodiesterase CpdA